MSALPIGHEEFSRRFDVESRKREQEDAIKMISIIIIAVLLTLGLVALTKGKVV